MPRAVQHSPRRRTVRPPPLPRPGGIAGSIHTHTFCKTEPGPGAVTFMVPAAAGTAGAERSAHPMCPAGSRAAERPGGGRGGGGSTWRGRRAAASQGDAGCRADCISRKSGEGVLAPDRPLRGAGSQPNLRSPAPFRAAPTRRSQLGLGHLQRRARCGRYRPALQRLRGASLALQLPVDMGSCYFRFPVPRPVRCSVVVLLSPSGTAATRHPSGPGLVAT